MIAQVGHKWRKYLLLMPMLFLAMNAIYFKFTTDEIRSALLNEKYIEIVNAVDMLGAAVEANPEKFWLDFQDNVCDSVEFLDKLYQIYAGVYKFEGDRFVSISEHFHESTPFEPLEYSQFVDMVTKQENGSFIIGYTLDHQSYAEVHLYFKWMPMYSPVDERFLVVAGVSAQSIISSISIWVSVGQWVSMAITFVLNTWLILMIIRMGNIYKKRVGDKWRN